LTSNWSKPGKPIKGYAALTNAPSEKLLRAHGFLPDAVFGLAADGHQKFILEKS